MFEKARWIWRTGSAGKDQYVLFVLDLPYNGGDARMHLCADSDFHLTVNGKTVGFGQYHDYEEQAKFEEILLTDALRHGENRVEILVWHYGETNFAYSLGKAGLLFEVLVNGSVVAYSGEHILCAKEPHYLSGYCKPITAQLGYGFFYDAARSEAPVWEPSAVVEKPYPVGPRPVKRLTLGKAISGRLLRSEGKRKYLFDFSRETVGFLRLLVRCDAPAMLTVSYGEHLVNGEVPRVIRSRDFSVTYRARAGENDFLNAFRRLGCRYVCVEGDLDFDVIDVQLLPTDYPVTVLPFDAGNALRQRIYDTAVYTLQMCMHEHYEDCPWREQALYAMDSRNQMLCGYYAFAEYPFARASLALFANARRCGGLLPICAPCDHEKTIPSFGLHYFTEVLEYVQYASDLAFGNEIYGALCELIDAYGARMERGLLPEFEGDAYWNFYEWKQGLDKAGTNRYHLVLNTLYLKALQSMAKLATLLSREDIFTARAEDLKRAIAAHFYDAAQGLFVLGKEEPLITELGNYLCVLTGVVEGDAARALIDRLEAFDGRITLTLSMLCFAYDAKLLADKTRYAPLILADIDTRWGKMLDAGATTFWETELGAADFNGAGSLCHGWAALPVYYYHILRD